MCRTRSYKKLLMNIKYKGEKYAYKYDFSDIGAQKAQLMSMGKNKHVTGSKGKESLAVREALGVSLWAQNLV